LHIINPFPSYNIIIYGFVPAEEQKVRTSGQHDDYGYYVFGFVITRQSQRRYGHHEQAREQEHHSCRCYGLRVCTNLCQKVFLILIFFLNINNINIFQCFFKLLF